ncbi:MAG: hypothetical protein AB7D43_00350 [Sulfurimonadaceae bacterium]
MMRFFVSIFLFFLSLHAGTVVDKVSIEAKETPKGVEVFFEFHTRYEATTQNSSMKEYGKSSSFCTLVDYTDNKVLASASLQARSLYSNYFSKPLLLPLSVEQKQHLKGVKITCATQLGDRQFFSSYKLPIRLTPPPTKQQKQEYSEKNKPATQAVAKKILSKQSKKFTSSITLGKLKIQNVTKISHRNNNPNEFLIEGSNGNFVFKKEDLQKAVFHNISKKSLQTLEKKTGIKVKIQNKEGAKTILVAL